MERDGELHSFEGLPRGQLACVQEGGTLQQQNKQARAERALGGTAGNLKLHQRHLLWYGATGRE
jgi:hypothetical protein